MNLATILNNKTGLPDWRLDDDPNLRAAAAAVDAAQSAISDAESRRDEASAKILQFDAELAASTDLREANSIEDRRDAALADEAKAARDLERAKRGLERAVKNQEPLESAAIRNCSQALRAIYAKKVGAVVRTLDQLREDYEALDAVADHVKVVIPAQDYPSGGGFPVDVLRKDVGGDFNEPPILVVPRLLERIVGRRGQSIDQFLARLREWNLA